MVWLDQKGTAGLAGRDVNALHGHLFNGFTPNGCTPASLKEHSLKKAPARMLYNFSRLECDPGFT